MISFLFSLIYTGAFAFFDTNYYLEKNLFSLLSLGHLYLLQSNLILSFLYRQFNID